MGCGHKIRLTQMGYGHKLLERDARMNAVIESLDAVHLRLSDDALRRPADAGVLTVMSNRETHQSSRQGWQGSCESPR